MTRTQRILLAVALSAGALAVIPMAASAGVATCGGEVATIIADGTGTPIEGTEGDDVIVGYGGKDTINGNGGNDIICGRGGADTINGGDGDDTIWGQNGHDTIKGNKGDDLIRPGHGNDRVWGNGGHDKVWAYKGSDVCVAEEEWGCELDKRWGHEPEDWLSLLDEYFGDIGETANALVVLDCESNGEPFIVNPVSGTTGLMQYRDWIWDWINQDPDVPEKFRGEVREHPEASIATARVHYEWALDDRGYGWQPWVNCGCHPKIESPDKPADCPYTP
jgi:hypothetical protein